MSNPANGGVELTGVTKRFVTPAGTAMTAIRDVTFTVAPGEFVAIVGPTGCGKSTTLTLASGLYLADCTTRRGEAAEERPRTASIVLRSPGGAPLDQATSGFA